MSECDYWWTDDSADYCGLTNGRRACSGIAECCPIYGSALSEALRRNRRVLARESLMRARRRREFDTAN